MELFISSFSSVNFCLVYLETLMKYIHVINYNFWIYLLFYYYEMSNFIPGRLYLEIYFIQLSIAYYFYGTVIYIHLLSPIFVFLFILCLSLFPFLLFLKN